MSDIKKLQLPMLSDKLRLNYHNALVKTKTVNKLATEFHYESFDFMTASIAKPTKIANSKRKHSIKSSWDKISLSKL